MTYAELYAEIKDHDTLDFLTDYIDEDEQASDEEISNNELETIREKFDDAINEQEIIYYSNAIKYLSENDASLNESISLAIELGYTDLESINSEFLATILYQSNLREDLAKLLA